jgi:hypothetical protein
VNLQVNVSYLENTEFYSFILQDCDCYFSCRANFDHYKKLAQGQDPKVHSTDSWIFFLFDQETNITGR